LNTIELELRVGEERRERREEGRKKEEENVRWNN